MQNIQTTKLNFRMLGFTDNAINYPHTPMGYRFYKLYTFSTIAINLPEEHKYAPNKRIQDMYDFFGEKLRYTINAELCRRYVRRYWKQVGNIMDERDQHETRKM